MEALRLLWGTLLLRPYVFLFLGAALVAAAAERGLRGALWFAGIVWTTAFLAEFASTRIGDRKSTRLNSSHIQKSRMPSSA